MKNQFYFLLAFVMLAFTGCKDDDEAQQPDALVAVSFANPSVNVTDEHTSVQILFSGAVAQSGSVTVSLQATGATYGTEFSTTPAAVNNTVVVPFQSGATSASFTFNKLVQQLPQGVKNVKFTITNTSFAASITGVTAIQVNLNETASLGSVVNPQVGGPTQPNQVYIDLSTGTSTPVARTAWDLGFYSGDDFRVAINGSLKMAAKQLTTTNIDEVVEEDETMIIGQGSGSASQIDNPAGNIDGTAIAAVSANDDDNKVHLIYMGNGPAATAPVVGADGSAGGAARGWKKVRVLKSGSDYKLQYADIDATTHQEVTITKNAAYNFTFFSLATNAVVQSEPQKNQWDINFTTFTNLVGPTTPYYYADFIVTNTKGGARSYMVLTADKSYENFTQADIDESKFTADQRNIGSNWRSTSVTGPDGNPMSQFVLKTDRFFVVKDPAGNVYKLKITGGANSNNERGFPVFQYALVR
jgi:hypothetical protein